MKLEEMSTGGGEDETGRLKGAGGGGGGGSAGLCHAGCSCPGGDACPASEVLRAGFGDCLRGEASKGRWGRIARGSPFKGLGLD